MDSTTVATLSGAAGVLMGAGAILAVRQSERSQHRVPDAPPPAVPAGVRDVLAVLRSSAIIVDSAERVVNNSPAAVAYGLVHDDDLVHAELRHLARQVRRDGVIREADLELSRGALASSGTVHMRARVAPLSSEHVVLLLEDQTQARRVDEVRRDFIANVSHELKTPVGGLALLAEAVEGARDDPEAVERFARRMQVEAARLARLVKEIVDLSRLQAEGVNAAPELVDIGHCVDEAIDHTHVAADAKQIELVASCAPALMVYGDADLIVTALRNLLTNAVSYSDAGTKVAVAATLEDRTVQVVVTDQGQGIPATAQSRIFERFYRVDAARSRATGGTGLGLSIVKHICENHGGSVTVWSEEGRGSTFTVRLPAAAEPVSAATAPDPARPTGRHDPRPGEPAA